jgi:hypothetical protein
MTPRTLGALGLALFLVPTMLAAQAAPQPPGAATPGPAASRPQMPPRDGAAAVPTGTAGIRGRVMAADTNTPLRRAQVRITGAQPGIQQTANTDADGRYEFAKLPASRYTITVTRNGYVTLQFGQQRPFEPGKPLNLAEGEIAEKIDFALPRGGVITGRVTDTLGEPLAGVRMDAQRYQYLPGGQRRLTSAGNPGIPFGFVTDDLGQFRVYGLMPGAYVVSASPPIVGASMTAGAGTASSGGDDGYTTTYFPGTSNADEAQSITVGVGQEANASFAVVSGKMSRISGVVRNAQGNPVGRVQLMLATRTAAGGSSTGGTTQADGSFAFANVAPGEHSIDVRPIPGTVSASDEFASVPFTASGQDITGLIITTGGGATLAGRVVFEGNAEPPQGLAQQFRVLPGSADPSTPLVMGLSPDSGLVDETGHFQVRGVSGRLLFRAGSAQGPPVPGWYLKSVTLNGVDITDTGFDAKPATNTTGFEVTMTNRQTTLSGAVNNARGDAIKDFVVAVFPAAAKEGMAATRFVRAVRPDQQGRYETKGLPPGDYVAVAVESLEQGGEWDPAFQQQMKPKGKSLSLTDGQSATLDLTLVQ